MEEYLLEKVKAWADRNHVLLPGTAVVAGVSGGSDSVCLLHVLLCLAKHRRFSIFAVHINHMLRGSESDGDEVFVRELCAGWNLPLQVFREDVGAFSIEKGCSVEEAGRAVRYEYLRRVLVESGAQHIAVAHHRADQSETVFMHLLRGSGLDGLCGMEDISGNVIRPFLNISKAEIEAYLSANHLQYRTDSSNQDNSYVRNAIRNDIFPQIEQKTGFSVKTSLVRMAGLLKSDRDYLNQLAAREFQAVIVSKNETTVVLNRKVLNNLHPSMAGRVIRMAWQEITGSPLGLEQKHIVTSLKLSENKASGKAAALPKGIRCIIEYNSVILAKSEEERKSSPWLTPVTVQATVELPGKGIRISTNLYTREEYVKMFGEPKKAKEGSLIQFFDYDRINEGINISRLEMDADITSIRSQTSGGVESPSEAPVFSSSERFHSMVIRNRRPGDIFFPYHSPGRKKLKEFFIDEKIPPGKREDIPLLAVDNIIIWVVGLRTSENYKVNDSTGSILSVRVTSMD